MEWVGFKRCMRRVIRRAYGLAALFGVLLLLAAGLHGGETHATSAGPPDTAYADAGGSDPNCAGRDPCEHDTLSGLHRTCSAATCSLLTPRDPAYEFLPLEGTAAFRLTQSRLRGTGVLPPVPPPRPPVRT
jgi:hypothetical protein